jgi:predicted PurR-regulated permease PerM
MTRDTAGYGMPLAAVEMAILGFFIILGLYFGRAVLMPLALAVILSFALAPAVRLLRRSGLPNSPAVLVVVVLTFSIIGGLGALLTQQAGQLAQEVPRYQLILKDKVKALKDATAHNDGVFERAGDVLGSLQKELEQPEIKSAAPPSNAPLESTNRPIPVEVHAPEPTPLERLESIVAVALAPLATAGIVLVFVLFLLLQREDVRDRAIRLLGSSDLEKSTVAMIDAGDRLSRYFLTLTELN